MDTVHPVTSSGRDYLCARCREVVPEGAHVHHGEDDGALTWVRAVSADGDVLHECGEAPGG